MLSPTFQPEPVLEGFVDVLCQQVESIPLRHAPYGPGRRRQMYANVESDVYLKIKMALKHTKRSSGDLVGLLVQAAIHDGWLDVILANDEVERLKRQYGDKWGTILRAIKADAEAAD